jgi:hypothetical protein
MTEFRNQISLGNLMQIGVVLCALAVAWGAMQQVTQAQGRTLNDHEDRIRLLEQRVSTTLERIDARLGHIEKELGR